MSIYFKLLSIFIFLSVTACTQTENKQNNATEESNAQVEKTKAEVKEITVSEFQKLMQNDKAVVVDVREPMELAEIGFIENSINVPAYKLASLWKEKVNADKDAIILTYCLSGYRSGVAAEELIEMGYTNVYSLRGGIGAWINSNLPVVK